MKTTKRFIKNLDFYGQPLSFNIKGKEDIRSFIGGISSLIYQLIFLVLFSSNFYSFAFNRTPIITVTNLFRSLENIETIPEDKFLFLNFFSKFDVSGLKEPNLTTIQNANKIILSTYENTKNTMKSEKDEIGNLISCNSSPFFKDNLVIKNLSMKIESKDNVDFAKCFNFKNNTLSLGGDFIYGNIEKDISMTFTYNICDYLNYSKCNITEKSHLPSSLNGIYLINFLKNHYINYNNKNGFSEFYQNINTPIDFDLDYFFEIKVKKVVISTDNNYIYNIIPNKVITTYIYSINTSTTPKKPNTRYELFSLNYFITPDIYEDSVERSYLKFDGMLANIGSIMALFDFALNFLSDFFSEGKFEYKIFKDTFFIKKDNHKFFNYHDKILIDEDEKILKNNILNLENNKRNNENINELNGSKIEKVLKEENSITDNLSKINNLKLTNCLNLHKNIKNSDKSIINIIEEKTEIQGNNNEEIEMKNLNKEKIEFDEKKDNKNEVEENNLKFIKLNDKNKIEIDKIKTFGFLNNNQLVDEKDSNKKLFHDDNFFMNLKKEIKGKQIKKSNLVKLYQVFIPCKIKNNRNIQQLINLQDFVSEELDVVKILKKLIEYENFKSLFLSTNQIKLFNIMQKRVITDEILDNDTKDYYKSFYFKKNQKNLEVLKEITIELNQNSKNNENNYKRALLENTKNMVNI